MSAPIFTVDSWWGPTPTALATAKAHGVGAWLGYISNGQDRIYRGWTDADFAAVKAAGMKTGGYCSGWADPLWVKAQSARLGVVAILDCESSIRGGGPWVDPWLTASGASFYGLSPDVAAHSTHGHPGYVLAGYPSNSGTALPYDPGLTFGTTPLPNPARPIARQWAGSVPTAYGNVDYSWFDPAFFGTAPVEDPDAMTNDLATTLAFLELMIALGRPPSLDELNSRAGEIVAKGATAVLWELTGSAEGKATGGLLGQINAVRADVTAVQGALAKLPSPSGGAPAPHTHPVSGTTGSNQ